jgi:hypothetical protein
MPFANYVELIQKRALHFTRIDRFERDPSEGDFTEMAAAFEQKPGELTATGSFSRMRNLFAVSSWCQNPSEMMSFWERYGQHFGVAIRTTYARLCEAFNSETRFKVFVGRVSYGAVLDAERGDLFPYALRKRVAFHDESEVRALISGLHSPIGENKASWPREGCDLHVDLERLIEEVVVGPPWQKWFYELVLSVSRAFGISTDIVKQSKLMDSPYPVPPYLLD